MGKFRVVPVLWFVDRVNGDWRGVSADNAQQAFERCLWAWEAVCGIKFLRAFNENEAAIVLTAGDVDGRGGVLAHSQFAGEQQDGVPVRIKLDVAEWWCYVDAPVKGYVDLGRVLLHEVGHAMGIKEHGPDGGAMAASYEASTRTLDAWCVRQAQQLYGDPK